MYNPNMLCLEFMFQSPYDIMGCKNSKFLMTENVNSKTKIFAENSPNRYTIVKHDLS